MVDRAKSKSRYETYQRSINALKEGFSLAIFPEGGILAQSPPQMADFKDGAFRMALETGVSLVPVSFRDNWHIFPCNGKIIFNRRKCRIVFHEPIDPLNYSMEQLDKFSDDVKRIIQQGIDGIIH